MAWRVSSLSKSDFQVSAGLRSGCYAHIVTQLLRAILAEWKGTYSLMDAVQAISAMKIIGLEEILLQRVLGANRNDGLGRPQGLEALGLA